MRAFLLLAAVSLTAQAPANTDFHRMAATERAFAAATREIGVRDGFLTFFASDAIDIAPVSGRLQIVSATARLASQPKPHLPLVTELTWEPRWGAMSSAGDLGWLTGPYRIHSVRGGDPDRNGAYFSIWRREPDGTYKVRLDIGIATARPVDFPGQLTAAASPVPPPAAPPDRSARETAIRTMEAQFAEAAVKDVGSAYRAVLASDARLHRNERSPFVGADAAASFMGSTFQRITWAVLHAEVSSSGDLAFTAGSYDAAAKSSEGRPGSPERGFFVRVWHRGAQGDWKLAFETNGIR